MLERYYLRPDTCERIRSSWIAEPIEHYVGWLAEHGYAARNVFRRVPILRRFGEFARARGATRLEELPAHVEAFAQDYASQPVRITPRRQLESEARNPIEQMLRLALAEFHGHRRARWARTPFEAQAGGFFAYLQDERGLRPASLVHYRHQLARFERYLERIGCRDLAALSPPILGAFVTEMSGPLGRSSLTGQCAGLRVFLRYLHRQRLVGKDLSAAVELPRHYRLADLPRSISWDEVRRMLEAVDRRSSVGKRDYAILVLLVSYALRAHEVAALTLDDIDWKRERLRIPERKAGHSTAYPLSPTVGAALLEYLQHGRPASAERNVFLRVLAPPGPLTQAAVSSRASYYLHRAGIAVARAGSHTLRHTSIQRLVDADFPFKVIGDYVGHRSAESTETYTKVALEALREVALGECEALV